MGWIKTIETEGKRLLVEVFTSVVNTPSVRREEILATPPRRILVIRQHNQMGDMLLAVPALRAIKESIPGVEVTVLTGRINRDVMLNNPYVDRVLTYEPRNPLSWSPMIREMRRLGHDIVIVLHTVSFSFTSAMLGLISGSRWRVGSTSAPFGNRMSKAFYHLELPLPSESELANMNEAEHNLYPLGALGIRKSREHLAAGTFCRGRQSARGSDCPPPDRHRGSEGRRAGGEVLSTGTPAARCSQRSLDR
jgi:hypothetical protein